MSVPTIQPGDPRAMAPSGGEPAGAGFGLIEALVAIVVLGVGVVALASMSLSVAGQSRSSTYLTEQTLVAQEVMEYEIEKGYANLPVSSRDTTVQMDSRTYDVEVVVTDAAPRARRVDLTVSGRVISDTTRVFGLVHRSRPVPQEYAP